MEITVQLPNQEIIDFDETCYALVVKQVSGIYVMQVGKTIEEAKQKAIQELNVTKTNYKRYSTRYINQAGLGVPSENKHHRGRLYEIAECDKKLYLYYNEKSPRYNNFIFDGAISPLRLKYSRKIYYGR